MSRIKRANACSVRRNKCGDYVARYGVGSDAYVAYFASMTDALGHLAECDRRAQLGWRVPALTVVLPLEQRR